MKSNRTFVTSEIFLFFALATTLAAQSLPLQRIARAAQDAGAAAASAQSLAQAATTTLTEKVEITPPEGANSFGYAVALDGNRAVIGGFGGSAYVHVLQSNRWTLQGVLTPTDGMPNNTFGSAVAISQNRVVVGAPYDTATLRAGAVYVFAFDGTTWPQEAKLIPSGSATNDFFGFSVALQGRQAVVGSFGENGNTGAAYVFSRNGTTWRETQKLLPIANSEGGEFGISVSLSGRRALVGAYSAGNDLDEGAGYVFSFDGATWSLEKTLTASASEGGDLFGQSVSISGDRAVIGAPDAAVGRGAAYVFFFNGTSWSLQKTLSPSDGVNFDNFGNSVSVSGDQILVGANGDDSHMGSAYLFAYDGTTWIEQDKLVASDGAPNDQFGFSVSQKAGRALVGALAHPASDDASGAAYFFGGF